MNNRLIVFVAFLSVTVLSRISSGDAEETSDKALHQQSVQLSCRLKNADGWLKAAFDLGYTTSTPLDRGGYGLPYLNVLDSLTNSQDLIGPIAAEVLQMPAMAIKVVPYERWAEIYEERRVLGALDAEIIFISGRFECKENRQNRVVTGVSGDQVVMDLVVFPSTGSDELPWRLATRIAQAIAEKLPKASEIKLANTYETKVKEYQQAYDSAKTRIKELDEERFELLKTQCPIPLERIVERIATIEQQLLATELAAAGLEARTEAVKEQIAIAAKTIKEEAAGADEMSDALRGLIKAREAEVEHLKDANRKAPGSINQNELDRAAGKVLETRIQLLQAQNKQRGGVENDRLNSLNSELTKLMIDVAELNAKRRFLKLARNDLVEVRARYPKDESRVLRLTDELINETGVVVNAEAKLGNLKPVKQEIVPLELVVPKADTK